MRIKTITCHNVYNHGASLQEHALLKYLSDAGHDVEAINYNPSYLSNHFKIFAGSSNPKFKNNILINGLYILAKLPSRLYSLKRKNSFDEFEKKYIKSTHSNYTTNEDLKNNIPNAEAYICGSDQIWNSFFQNGKDPAFYLDFVPDDKLKISYAASFAIDEIEEELKPFVKEKVERINHISVRETSGQKILKGLGISETTQVLDPVFLLPKKYWADEFIKELPSDYIFVYDFDSNDVIEKLAKKLAKKNDLRIITVNSNIKYADENLFLEGPETFLNLMFYAKYVITNSFHSVAFSLIFEKQFVVVNRSEKINTRMRDLLALVGLSDILIDNVSEFNEEEFIDYKEVNIKLENLISHSKNFLKESLK